MVPSYPRISLPPALTAKEPQQIISLLEKAGGQARFVGGCVRDAILQLLPGDIDIATSLTPETVIEVLKAASIKVIPTGIKHGTVTAVMNKKPFEITTLRRDVACYGRHAEVEYTDNFEEDAARRDFTINAMYCDPEGVLYDYFGGYADLHRGVVRFVGNADNRVEEDYLRSLRFFRFFARFGKPPMDMGALAAITLHANSLEQLSGERIQKEMFGLLAVPKIAGLIEAMAESRVLGPIALPCQHFVAFNELLMLEETPSPLVRLAILLRATASPVDAATKLVERWRLSNHDKATILPLVGLPDQLPPHLSLPAQKQCLRTVGKTAFISAVMIAWAEFLAKNKGQANALEPAFSRMLSLAANWDIPHFPVKGRDLQSLGFAEGKQIGIALAEAERWWEEQDYRPNRKEILDYIKR